MGQKEREMDVGMISSSCETDDTSACYHHFIVYVGVTIDEVADMYPAWLSLVIVVFRMRRVCPSQTKILEGATIAATNVSTCVFEALFSMM